MGLESPRLWLVLPMARFSLPRFFIRQGSGWLKMVAKINRDSETLNSGAKALAERCSWWPRELF